MKKLLLACFEVARGVVEMKKRLENRLLELHDWEHQKFGIGKSFSHTSKTLRLSPLGRGRYECEALGAGEG